MIELSKYIEEVVKQFNEVNKSKDVVVLDITLECNVLVDDGIFVLEAEEFVNNECVFQKIKINMVV